MKDLCRLWRGAIVAGVGRGPRRSVPDGLRGRAPALLNAAGDGIVAPPCSLFGATDGLLHHYKIVNDGTERVLGCKEVGVVVNPGDHIVCLSSGGGSWDLMNEV